MLQQEVRLRREPEQPRRGKAAKPVAHEPAANRDTGGSARDVRRSPPVARDHAVASPVNGKGYAGSRWKRSRRSEASVSLSASGRHRRNRGVQVRQLAAGRQSPPGRSGPRCASQARSMASLCPPPSLRQAVLPNPSLNTRPREAWRPGAAQGSRRLHCPARR